MTFFRHPCFFKTLAACALSLAAGLAFGGDTVVYRNPVIAGDHPDPTILRVGKHDYWAAATSGDWGPEFELWHSRDLVNWKLKGAVFSRRPDWAERSFWAPELWEYKGHYLAYYAARKYNGPLSVAVATAEHPEGPYVDRGPLVSQPDGSIDPSAVLDENGKPYLIWKEDGNSEGKPTPIWAQPLDESGTKVTGQPVELIRNDADWEGPLVEGPYILRRGDWFYLFYSGNGCCGPRCDYALGVARSHKLLGPWEKDPVNPILSANDTWKCPGHGTVVTDPRGRYWLLYHAYPAQGATETGRESMLDEVVFGADGWPTINEAHGPSVAAPSPFGVAQRKVAIEVKDNFWGKTLDAGWRRPLQREPKYWLRRGHLYLAAEKNDRTNLVAALVARATGGAGYWAKTTVDGRAMKPGTAAGLAVMARSGAAAGVVVRDGHLVAWRREGWETEEVTEPQLLRGKTVHLRVAAQPGHSLEFFASMNGKDWLPVGKKLDDAKVPPLNQSEWVALTVGGAPGAEGCFGSFKLISTTPKQSD